MPALAHLISHHPILTLVGVFSAGIGLGMLATAVIARSEEGWWHRHGLPESFHDLGTGLRRVPEMIAQHLPESITGR
jgi:hypothetical protein